jgi:hypothetical protein
MAQVATPVITLAAGFYAGSQSTTITCATGGSTIFYTTDGTTPTHTAGVPSGTTATYSGAITIAASKTIKALGYLAADTDSAVASSAYHILAISAISPASVVFDQAGQTHQLSGGVVTGGITNVTDWTSSGTGIATVGAHTGLVTAVAPGTVTITATADELNTLSVTSSVEVGAIVPADITHLQSFLVRAIQSVSSANPFEAAQQAKLQTALADLQSNTLTAADLEILQSLINDQVQYLGTANPFTKSEQAAYTALLADLRSLI